jgi:four helix bundle protein
MNGVRSLEDLIAWQKARELTRLIYLITRTECFARDIALSNQLQRASVSVMSNIAERFERSSTKDFLRFVITAKASCAEVRSHLYIAHDVDYLTEDQFQELFRRANELSRIIGGLRLSLRKKLCETKRPV